MKKPAFRPRIFFLWLLFVFCLTPSAPVRAQQSDAPKNSSGNLYDRFKAVEMQPCGQRAEAVRLGKLILEQYQLAESFAASFKTRLTVLEEEEARCTGQYVEKSLGELYSEFLAARKSPCGKGGEALRIARQIVEKFSVEDAEVVKFVKSQIPVIEREAADCANAETLATLFEDFKNAKNLPCGQRAEALRIGREIGEKFAADELNGEVVKYVKLTTAQIAEAEVLCRDANSLSKLLEEFRNAVKEPCGKRDKVETLGKRIVEFHRTDESKRDVIRYVEDEMSKTLYLDYVCELNASLEESYTNKNWGAFLSRAKGVLGSNANNPRALDMMLTFVLTAYKNTAYKGSDLYNSDAVFYAAKAIDMIEDGVKTQAQWGTFEPFGTKEKALAWMNYTIGYITYFRQKDGKKAIPYFYRAAQYQSEFKYDAFVYHAVAIHYFEMQAVTVSSLTINQFINRATSLGQLGETNDSNDAAAKNAEVVMLYQQLVNLYELRYNLEPNENVTGLTDYILKLIGRPLIDTARTKANNSTADKN